MDKYIVRTTTVFLTNDELSLYYLSYAICFYNRGLVLDRENICSMKSEHYYHLIRRAGFGSKLELEEALTDDREQVVGRLFEEKAKVEPLLIDYPKLTQEEIKNLNEVQKKELQKLNRKKIAEHNVAWLNRMVYSDSFLRERMTFFWSTLFVTSGKNIRFVESFNNTLRNYALDDFKTLITAVSKEANMLSYLDNNKNKKQSPNENFARELMELFTLGRDVLYSEQDIKEAARAFTGWRYNAEGKFINVKRQHDDGEKLFLNQRGNFDGDDIIRILLEQKECAYYLCTRIYKHFVNDEVDEGNVQSMVKEFYPHYNIEALMRFVFNANWFYSNNNINAKIKSPIELLVGLNRLIPYRVDKPKQLIMVQRMLGQVLHEPPNVAGWPGGKEWIDSNTLMTRLRLPSLLLNGGMIESDLPMEANEKERKRKKALLKVSVDWDYLSAALSLLDNFMLNEIVIGEQPKASVKAIVEEDDIQKYLLKLISIPEYQMC